ncbi:MAG: ABC transporter permease [Planctomycetota bacterium]
MTTTSLPLPAPTVIVPTKGWFKLNIRELWQYRDLCWTLAGRDVRLRYRQTALGVAWVVLQPLMAAGIFTLVFGVIAGLESPGVPYFVFAYAGMMGWTAFSTTLNKTSTCIVQNAPLIAKVFFPRAILPFSVLGSTLLDFVIALVMMVVLMAVYGVEPSWALLTLPIWIALIMALAVGLGLSASALMVSYRDVQYIVPVLMQFLMYASPVAYSVSEVPEKWKIVFLGNPLSGLLEGMRWALFSGQGEAVFSLSPGLVTYTVLFSLGMALTGLVSFQRMERKFADVI